MIVFFDASALVKRYVRELETDRVLALLSGATPVVSRLTEVEIASALARRLREGSLARDAHDSARASLMSDLQRISVLELSSTVVRRARDLVGRHPLRAGDALQLASCLEFRERVGAPVDLVAYDDRLVAAATAEGLRAKR